MKFFIDTADIPQIEELMPSGLIDGVTTNPSLIAKSGQDMGETIKTICSIVSGPVSAEVTATEYDKMLEEGEYLASLAKNVAVKVPLTPAGLQTCKALRKKDIMVNVTLCFSAAQALLAAKVGATFISPFVGRLDDIGEKGMDLISDIVITYENYGFDTEVLVASVRNTQHLIDAAVIGAHVSTLPPKVIHELYKHPLTDKGLKAFLDDWAKTGQQILPKIIIMANDDEIREKEIINFLKKNKNFFIKNSELVNELNFPTVDNSSGKVVDLEAYRYRKISQQNIDLQNQMTKVLLAGKSHLNAQKRILKSTIRILNIKSLPKLISLIKNDLKTILGCDEMNCFVTNENIRAENLSQLDIKIANSYFKNKMVTNLNQNPKGLLLFFPNKSATIKSYILLKVKLHEDSIILAMGSKDKNKFTVDMQTDLVEYLIKIIEVNLLSIK